MKKIIITESMAKSILKENVDQVEFYSKLNWEPLYSFFKEIFQGDYIKASDSMMYMNSFRFNFNGQEYNLHVYKHGMTRKSLSLNDYGEPIDVDMDHEFFRKEDEKLDSYLVVNGVTPMSYSEAYKRIYVNMDKHWVPKEFEGLNRHFIPYKKYKPLLDKQMIKWGYNTFTASDESDFENFDK